MEASQPSRRGDAALIVCQNNLEKRVFIDAASGGAEELLGLSEAQLKGKNIEDIFAARTVEALNDFLEYEEDSGDLDEILPRIRDIKVVREGNEIPVEVKIVREPARDRFHWFRLILRDEDHGIVDASLRKMLQANLEGHQALDKITELPDRDTALKAIELTSGYVAKQSLQACFAVIRIDRHSRNHEVYGRTECSYLLRHIANACRRNFRSDDVICRISEDYIGVVLFDISDEAARIVLNRLRWFISAHRLNFGGKSDFSVTISVSFAKIGEDRDAQVLERCEKALMDVDEQERNQLIELDAA